MRILAIRGILQIKAGVFSTIKKRERASHHYSTRKLKSGQWQPLQCFTGLGIFKKDAASPSKIAL
jgi:hypothetical protein